MQLTPDQVSYVTKKLYLIQSFDNLLPKKLIIFTETLAGKRDGRKRIKEDEPEQMTRLLLDFYESKKLAG